MWRRSISRNSDPYSNHETWQAVWFNTPLIVITISMILLPVVGTLITSLYRDVAFMPRAFTFPDNYIRLFTDARFWQSVEFTLLFTLLSVSIELLLGLLFALLLNEALPGRGFLRIMLLLPWAIPNAVSARVWELIYNYQFGILNYLLMSFGLVSHPVNWLGTQSGAMLAVLAADIWKMTPFVAIILLAGLSAIPKEIYSQAMIDGAGMRQRLFHVTLKLLKPALVVAVLFRTIDSIRVFDLLYVLTGGGPGGGTTSLSLYAYKYYVSGDLGYGSAMSVVVFLIAFGLSLVYIKLGRFREAIQ